MARDGWSRAFRDDTPSDDDLSDEDFNAYLAGNDLTRDLDISNRVDYAQVQVNPFTIAARNGAASKKSSSSRTTKKKAAAAKQEAQALAQAEEEKQKMLDIDQEMPSSNTVKEKKKKKRIGLLDLGGYESYQDLLEAAKQKAKKPGQSVEPAVPQPKLPKEVKKKQTQNLWPARKSGWTDCRGNPVGGVSRPKTKPKSTLDDMNEPPKVDQNQHQGKMKGKKPVAAPPKVPEKSIIQQLNETEATFRAAEAAEAAAKAKKKKPVKKEPAKGAKGKGKGKGKAGGDEVEKITFQRLPAGASTNDGYPIVDGLNKMKNLPKKSRKSTSESPSDILDDIPLDSLLPLTKVKANAARASAKDDPLDKKGKAKFIGKPSNKSAEYIDDSSESGRESIDPPSDADTAPRHKITLPSFNGGQAVQRAQSKSFPSRNPSPQRDEDMVPSLAHTHHTQPTDHLFTPRHEEEYTGNPSTMTHLSAMEPHLSDRTSGSSQFPHSSPALDKARRMDQYVYAPQPIRDKSRDISSLQDLVSKHQGRNDSYGSQGSSAPVSLPFLKQYQGTFNRENAFGRQHEDRSDSGGEGEEAWSTLPYKAKNRNAPRYLLDDRTKTYGPGSNARAIPFPKAAPPPPARAQPTSQAPVYRKITIFQPTPLGNHYDREDVEYKIANVPNGASIGKEGQYQVEPMQWKGSQREYNERQRPMVPQKERWVEEAERARLQVEERDWKEQWVGGGKKRGLESNPLHRYALSQDKKPRYEMEGRGQAFR